MKEDLRQLECAIAAERNDEVRHGLQRGRLEAERAQLLVRMLETVQRQPALAPTPYVVTWQTAPTVVAPLSEPEVRAVVAVARHLKPMVCRR
jgi:hypothetical protein